MLQALRSNPQKRAVAQSYTIPASVLGLNTHDAYGDMDPRYAIVMDNFFPEANYVALRRGYSSFATGMTSDVQTLITYHALNGSEKLFAAANSRIYDASIAGAASSSYSTSITSNKWQYINFTNTAGTAHLLLVNGADTMLKYDGSNWATNSITGSVSSSSNLTNIFQHKERVWFTEKNTLNLYYLPSQAISGAAVKLPLGGVFNNGGQIVAGGTLSINDSGDGMDDLLVAVTDNGEAAIYAGTNPASDFALQGVYPVGEPLGNRCLQRVGGDLIILTTSGAVSLKQIMANDRAQSDNVAITAKIQETFNSAARNWKSNFGWQGFVYPKGRMFIANVPEVQGVKQRQYVQNLITGAWCRFTNQNANCWGLLNDELYFGGASGVVYKADTGASDNGGQIEAELKTAFTHCGSPGRNKLFTLLRPLLLNSGTADLLAGIDVDYGNSSVSGTVAATAGNTCIWGSGKWGQSNWGGGGLLVRKWLTTGKIGTTAAARLKVAASGISVKVNGFDLVYQKGGLL